MARVNEPKADAGTSLWTTPAGASSNPLHAAKVDASVTAESVRAAVNASKERTQAFSGRVTEELLRKSV